MQNCYYYYSVPSIHEAYTVLLAFRFMYIAHVLLLMQSVLKKKQRMKIIASVGDAAESKACRKQHLI